MDTEYSDIWEEIVAIVETDLTRRDIYLEIIKLTQLCSK